MLFSAEQLVHAGLNVEIPKTGEAIHYNTRAIIEGNDISLPKSIEYNDASQIVVTEFKLENVMNYRFYGEQIVVSEETFRSIENHLQEGETSELVSFNIFQLVDTENAEAASTIFLSSLDPDAFITDFYSAYEESLQTFGLLIFIAGLLGLVFILSTGSILYFKQMTEAEQETSHYRTLRQLGFQVSDILRGIIRKQVFVYVIPLVVGLVHAAFALNVGSVLMATSMVTPIIISMTVYIVIYLLFALFTIGYYKRIVKRAL